MGIRNLRLPYTGRVDIPGIGPVAPAGTRCYRSDAVTVPALRNATCQLLISGYDDDLGKEDFYAAIAAFLAIDESVLSVAAAPIFEYYQDVASDDTGNGPPVSISTPDQVWGHIRPDSEALVQRDRHGDGHVYVSVECECDWEPEHGLQIVFRDGQTVTKVGPYDGHLTNAAAYDRDDLAGVIYHRL